MFLGANKGLVPIYSVRDDAHKIELNKLSNEYMLEMNHSSGMNIIVRPEEKVDTDKVEMQIKRWMKIYYTILNLRGNENGSYSKIDFRKEEISKSIGTVNRMNNFFLNAVLK